MALKSSFPVGFWSTLLGVWNFNSITKLAGGRSKLHFGPQY